MSLGKAVRVRYAPSPTGNPHVGNIRTALFNWLFARRENGVFIVRIEDTDRARLVEGALESLLTSLRWLGLDWDEGPEIVGPYAPYFQSQRLEKYQAVAQQLLRDGAAYRCYCSPERLAQMRAQQVARQQPPGYDRRCRNLSEAERARLEAVSTPSVVRFQVPRTGQTTFHDLFRGDIAFENALLDDHVLLKSDGWPTYQLANVVDDHLMEITHILRGDEWISSTPRHILLYRALGWEPPLIGHLPIILGKDRSKLSKRHGSVDLLWYRDRGYLPEAMVNFLALLGWSMDDSTELLSRDNIISHFRLERIGTTPAIFNLEKLDWMNGHYIRQLSRNDLAQRILPYLQKAGLVSPDPVPEGTTGYIRAIVPLIQERLKRLSEVAELTDFFFRETSYEPALLVPQKVSSIQTREALVAAKDRLETAPNFATGTLEGLTRPLAEELGLKTGQLFGTIRVAVTGRTVAPPLFETMAVLGRERCLERLGKAIALLDQGVAPY